MKKEMDYVLEMQKEILLLGRAMAVLSWDQEINIPEKGIESRAEQISYLSGLAHDRITSEKLFSSVNKLRKSGLKGDKKIMIEKLYKDIMKSRKIPQSHVKAMSHAVTMSGTAWRKARKNKNFKIFQPFLVKVIELKRKEAEYVGAKGSLYNALLDDYEEGMTAEELAPKFEKLKKSLVELLKKIEYSEKYKRQRKVITNKSFSKEAQEIFVEDVVERMGMRKDSSRVDVSEHPFTTRFGLNDVRITTSYRENPLFAFMSTVHEAGHALYELGLPDEHLYTVLGDAPSIGLHESQSRFWENMIGRSRAFWGYYYPRFKKEFKFNGSFEDWYDEVNYVSPGKIRVDSDEVHYCLHVILRFEIEVGLIEGKIEVKDLPKIWNSKMKELFGVTPKDDVEGVLQDVHWSMGSVGYFPTYALGSIYSAQLYNTIKKKIPGIDKDIRKGDFSKVRNWLKKNVHKHGAKFLAEDVIRKVCGEGLNPEMYIDNLNERYGEIYGF